MANKRLKISDAAIEEVRALQEHDQQFYARRGVTYYEWQHGEHSSERVGELLDFLGRIMASVQSNHDETRDWGRERLGRLLDEFGDEF
jgi:hypothetical protein